MELTVTTWVLVRRRHTSHSERTSLWPSPAVRWAYVKRSYSSRH